MSLHKSPIVRGTRGLSPLSPRLWMHPARRALLVFGLLIALALGGFIGRAQESSLDEVYATVQFNASLRAGPGTHWTRLAVLPFGTTYRVTGRTQDAGWIQIAYSGALETSAHPEATQGGITYGWVKTSLTFWTGDLFGAVPVDGVQTVSFVRGSRATVIITPDTPIYTGIIGPQRRVAYPLDGVARVEATGYYRGAADSSFVWVQFKIGDDYYWMSLLGGAGLGGLPDVGLLVASGRLNLLSQRNLRRVEAIYSAVAAPWNALGSGLPTSCASLPGGFGLIEYSDNDLARNPVYGALEVALTEAVIALERAADRLAAVCQTPGVLVPRSEIDAANADLLQAAQRLRLARLLLPPTD